MLILQSPISPTSPTVPLMPPKDKASYDDGTKSTDDKTQLYEPLSDPKPSARSRSLMTRCQNIFSNLKYLRLTSSQAWREATRNKGQYILGFSVVFIVVVIITVLMTTIYYSPMIFLGLAEYGAGEIDFIIFAPSNRWLNFTMVKESAKYEHMTPRFTNIQARVFVPNTCAGYNRSDWMEPTFAYTGIPINSSADAVEKNATRIICSETAYCLDYLCGNPTRVSLALIDSAREQATGLGRYWPYPPIHPNEVYIQRDVAETLDLQVNDSIYVSIPFMDHFSYHYVTALNMTNVALNSSITLSPYMSNRLSVPVKVGAIIDSVHGKFPGDTKNMMLMEYPSFLSVTSKFLHPDFPPEFVSAMSNISEAKGFYETAAQIVIQCAPPRTDCYIDSDFDNTASRLLKWASDLMFKIGYRDVGSFMPLLDNLDDTKFLSSFLNMLLSLVILVLGGLGVFLIYSLLMVSVETKTYELGIFRMVGMKRPIVLQLLMLQAMSYSLPALVIGLIVSQCGFLYLRVVYSDFFRVTVGYYLTPSSVFLAILMGVLVPVLSSILPIKRALAYNLHDSLDRGRAKTKAVNVTMERAQPGAVPLPMMVVGMVLFVFGFSIYYFLPMALIKNDLTLLFNIFLAILVSMVGGLVTISLNLQPLLETILVKMVFMVNFLENRGLKRLILKNLMAHRLRNKKTSILYATALGFIIFLTVSTTVEIQSMQYRYKRSLGTDILISTDFLRGDGFPAGVSSISTFEYYAESNPLVESYFWTTYRLSVTAPDRRATSISNIGRIQTFGQNVVAATPNLFEAIPNDYLRVEDLDPEIPYSPSEAMYSYKGQHSAILGAWYKESLSLTNLSEPVLLTSTFDARTFTRRSSQLLYPLYFASSAPIYSLTSFPRASQDAITSLPHFVELSEGLYKSVTEIPLRGFYIKLKKDITNSEYSTIKRELRLLLVRERMTDIKEELNGSEKAMSALSLVFDVVTVLLMVVTFFSLNTSMYVNIVEQTKEIGIMRSLGLNRFSVFRLYIYEAFFLIMSAATLGSVIGMIMGWTITAQRTILTEIPIPFAFPYRTFAIVLILSLICSVLSTVGPIWNIVFRTKLVSVLKG
ncbi:FtsX-like permease family-domain-containing protein [Paraphysoderma sedebokerense]|nr:FtsX-like permease family-domain-containing protein [Paraphysoderma sedebokerense]